MHLPVHPVWFWVATVFPCLMPLALWIGANTLKVSLKPLGVWLWGAYFLLLIPYLLVDASDGHRTLRFAIGTAVYTFWWAGLWITSHYRVETLRDPNRRWYVPWNTATFTVFDGTRILVRDIESVSPWYIEKLGLCSQPEKGRGEPGVSTFRFKEGGHSVVLTTRAGFGAAKTPILFTKKIGRMRDVMLARGVDAGRIEKDRQGVHYFQILDPEGNEIEVVEER